MKKEGKSKKNIFKYLLFGWFILSIFSKKAKKSDISLKEIEHNFLDFAHKEKKEFDKLAHHKEDIVEYVEDSSSIFKDYFIPHSGNNHHPKILRKKTLLIISIMAVMLKVSLVAYLFFIYPNDAQMSEDLATEVFQMLNEERVAIGLNPLKQNSALLSSATDKANDMIENDYFAHKSPDGRMPWDWVFRKDYPYLFIGENLGMSFSSAKSVHDALMNSPSHKKNILNEKYTDVGVVVRRGIINGKETNVLVQLFGSQKIEKLIPNDSLNKIALVTKEEEAKSSSLVEDSKKVFKEKAIEPVVEKTPEKKVVDAPEEVPVKGFDNEVEEELKEKIATISKEDIEELKNKLNLNLKKEEVVSSSSALLLGDSARSYIKEKIPTPDLEKDLNNKIEFVADIKINDKYTFAARVSDYSNVLLLGLLILMSVALFINIFVRLEVQHKPAIVQTLLLLVLLLGLYSTHLHFLEDLPNYITLF